MTVKTIEVGKSYKTNCYIVFEGGDCVVIDPGYEAEKIIAALDRFEVRPSYILITHGHPDHISAAKQVAENYGAKVAIGDKDAHRLSFEPDVPLFDGNVVGAGSLAFRVVSTPGHTEGGVCYICGGYLFSGDTLFSGDVGRVDLPGGDMKALSESLQKLAALDGDYTVLPGHEEPTTLAHERTHNRFMKLVD